MKGFEYIEVFSPANDATARSANARPSTSGTDTLRPDGVEDAAPRLASQDQGSFAAPITADITSHRAERSLTATRR